MSGQVLARLDTPDLDYRISQAERHAVALRYQLASVSFDENFRGHSQGNARDLQSVQAELAALAADKARHVLTSPFDGIVTDVGPQLNPGQWIGTRDPLLEVRGREGAIIDAYVAEEDLRRINIGDPGRFLAEGSVGSYYATVTSIDRTAVRGLYDPSVATPFGGTLSARITKQALVPDAAVYRVRLKVLGHVGVPVTLRGDVNISGVRESQIARLWRSTLAVILREWGA
jgi:putative peptide zinc metalloprotease protein